MNKEERQVAHRILHYLIDNPDAQDTIEGIVLWWIPIETIKRQTLLVKRVLKMLVKREVMIEEQGKDSRPRYKITESFRHSSKTHKEAVLRSILGK